MMFVDGRNVRCLTDLNSTEIMSSWFVDGKQIAFVSNRDGKDKIYTMVRFSENLARLTPNMANDWRPNW